MGTALRRDLEHRTGVVGAADRRLAVEIARCVADHAARIESGSERIQHALGPGPVRCRRQLKDVIGRRAVEIASRLRDKAGSRMDVIAAIKIKNYYFRPAPA